MNTYRRIAAIKTTAMILRFLAEQQEPLSPLEIARGLDLPKGTVFCHLATLEDENFVERTGEHYELGQSLAVMWASRKKQLESRIGKHTEQLQQLEV